MTISRNKAPSFFNFLKEGLLLPSRNRRLFTAVCSLILASTELLALVNDLTAQPLGDQIQLDHKALNTTEPGSPDFAKLLQENQNDTKELQIIRAGYLLFSFVVCSSVRIVIHFAALSVLLPFVRSSAKLSVVVAVAEPGCHSTAALGKAWRLANGKKLQVMLYFALTEALVVAVWPVRRLAMTRAGNSLALELLLGFVHAVLLALLQLFAACAMTAFYYESRENSPGRTATAGWGLLDSQSYQRKKQTHDH
ncbi:unnamed protein product [Alopecurus aequalis]